MFTNLHHANLEDFSNGWHWSSSQNNQSTGAKWALGGTIQYGLTAASREHIGRVRAARRFSVNAGR